MRPAGNETTAMVLTHLGHAPGPKVARPKDEEMTADLSGSTTHPPMADEAESATISTMPSSPRGQSLWIFGHWRARRLHGAIPDMDREEVTQATRVHSPKLVQELYEITQRQMKYESERQARLDSKANGLLALVSLSLTVLFTYGGGFLYTQRENLRGAGSYWSASLVLLAVASLFGIGASILAVVALQVTRGYRTLDERSVFNTTQLRKYDNEANDDDSLKEYRRYLLPDMGEIVQKQFRIHERKASLILTGQWCYVLFLLCLMAIGALMVVFAMR